MVSHGRNLSRLGLPCAEVEELITYSGLLPLCNISYQVIDKGLLSAFVERWQRDTNTFHLPFGEMSISLDDVSCLLHIPIMGRFPICYNLEFGEAAEVLVDLLGVQSSDGKKEMRHLRWQHVRLSLLRDVYEQSCEAGMWEYAARAYLLHLVGCTIFANKFYCG